MNDLEALTDMLTRARIPVGTNWRELGTCYVVEPVDSRSSQEWHAAVCGKGGAECVTEVSMEGGWTGVAGFHFDANGMIRGCWVAGD